MTIERVLSERREVSSSWHVQQAQRLLDVALEHDSASALVYSALEVRMGIERFVFETSSLATGQNLSEDQLTRASRRDGIFRLLGEAMGDYRKYLEFTNLVLDSNGVGFRINIPNLSTFRRRISSLSQYCHCQFRPDNTVEDASWFARGVELVSSTIRYIDELNASHGAMDRGTLAPEVALLLDRYLRDEIDAQAARTQLVLMKPVLAARRGMR